MQARYCTDFDIYFTFLMFHNLLWKGTILTERGILILGFVHVLFIFKYDFSLSLLCDVMSY